MKFDRFILFLLLSIIVGYFYPQPAIYNNGETLALITSIGVSIIFFFYGLKLSINDIKTGLSNWRLHVLIQSATFIIFPLVVLAFKPFITSFFDINIWLAFFFLAALPSTVSSSVVMVSIARGNIPAAIFNASISGLIGVLITPLWMGIFLDFNKENNFLSIYTGLFLEIILPVVLGLILQKYWGSWANKNSKALSSFDKFVILLIVYSSFAHSFSDGIFTDLDQSTLIFVFVGVVVVFILIYSLLYLLSKVVFKFDIKDQITTIFCGSKKSLTHGSVFGKFIFANNPYAGLYFLPLMVYHAFQILIITFIAQRYSKRSS